MSWRDAARPFTLTLLSVVIMTATASGQTVVRPGFNVFSVDQDSEIGKASALQVEQQLPMLNDAAAQRYVSALGARLAAFAPGPRFAYRFRIANLSDLNAFALPGGYIYVHRGLLEQVHSEGELAGVMAHEIAHVALRHPTNQASKAYLAQAGLGVLGGLFGGRGTSSTSQIVNALGGFGMNTLFLKFSRSVESQADVVGSQIMARAGYNPVEMANFFAYMAQQAGSNPSRVERFLSDHPAPVDREARVQQEASLIGPVRSTSPVGSLAAVQAQLHRYPAAPTSAQVAAHATPSTSPTSAPATQNGRGLSIETPSNRYGTFVQPQGGFQIDRPVNWTATAAAGAYGVTLLPRGGLLADASGNNDVVYGVIVNHYVPFDGTLGSTSLVTRGMVAESSPLEQATNDLVQNIQQANPNLSLIAGSEEPGTVAGSGSLSVRLSGRSNTTGRSESVRVVTRAMADGHVVYLLLIAPGDEYAVLEPTFDHILNSLRIGNRGTHN